MNIYRVAFIGHREIADFSYVENELYKVITRLVESKEYVEFYMGKNGEFDVLAASVVKRVQGDLGHANNCLILVLPYVVANIKYYEEFYDEVIIPVSSKVFPKAAITERNEWMLNNCDLLIACVQHSGGGTAYLFEKALKANKNFYLIEHKNNLE